MLQNAHNNGQLLYKIESILAQTENVSNDFRLLITCFTDRSQIPTHLLQHSITVMMERPRVSYKTF